MNAVLLRYSTWIGDREKLEIRQEDGCIHAPPPYSKVWRSQCIYILCSTKAA